MWKKLNNQFLVNNMEDKKINKIIIGKKTKIFFCVCLVIAAGFFGGFDGFVLAILLICASLSKGKLRDCGGDFINRGNASSKSHSGWSYSARKDDGWANSSWNYGSWAHRSMQLSHNHWRRHH